MGALIKRLALTFVGVTAILALVGCGADQDVAAEAEGIEVKARHDVRVSEEPLGDVVVETLSAGDVATAICYVPEAETNSGVTGSAIKIESGELAGYVPVTNFPDEAEDRQMLFDVEQDALSNELPTCADE